MPHDHRRLGDLLLAAGFVTADQLQKALDRQRATNRKLGEELVALGFVTEVQITQILSNQLSVPWVSLPHVEISRELVALVSYEIAQKYCLLPIYVRRVPNGEPTLFVALDDPTNDEALQRIHEITGFTVKPMVAPISDIRNAMRQYYPQARQVEPLPPIPTVEPSAPKAAPPLAPQLPPVPATSTRAPEEPQAIQAASVGREASSSSSQNPAVRSGKKPRILTLTFLDGTTIKMPQGDGATQETSEAAEPPKDSAACLIDGLRARAQGKKTSSDLPNGITESVLAAVLEVLIRKGLIADADLVDALQKANQLESKP